MNLIDKYNVPCPRYTSYPPVPVWKGISRESWFTNLSNSLLKDPSLSLYIHVPFCRELCAFCGCTKVITKDKSKGRDFLDAIKKEWELLSPNLKIKPNLKEMHLGGGSPSWLAADELDELLTFFLDNKKFHFDINDLELSIELDPRTTTYEQIIVLKKHNFKRVSLGVQDINPNVLTAIHRKQTFELIENIFSWLRNNDILQINVDLIYGLPHQSPQSIIDTLEKINTLKPTRIALYSYAHIPSLKPAQKIVERHGLPSAEEKNTLYNTAKKFLESSEYVEIGMDHFAKKEDKLYIAYLEGKLHRNFMGYTVNYSQNLLGLGPSSLSSTEKAFAQNEKEYKEWRKFILNNEIPIVHGHELSPKEEEKRKMIMNLMCKFETKLNQNSLEDWQKVMLLNLSNDQIVEWNHDKLRATKLGKTFIRNICMAIDDTFSSARAHSKSI